MFRPCLLLSISLLTSSLLFGQDQYYFYHGIPYGSESTINPGSIIINAGFDILQSATHSRELSTMKIGTGFYNVWENVKDPFPSIDKYGWGRFLGQEVFPTSLSLDKAQYFPNYTLHLIGGGMDSRMMYEWFKYYDVPYPTLMAGLTIATYHFVNEAAENDKFVGPNVDPLADLYIFDVGGVILFTSDAVANFFSTTLHMTAWPGQPAWNPKYNTIENQGQYYVIRYHLPFTERTSVFYHFGDNGMLGLSFRQENNESFSAGAGFAARELRVVDSRNGTRTETVTLGWIAGLFWDRDNSLLASFMASDRINEKEVLNIYPGVISVFGFAPGMFASLGKGNQFIVGITMRYLPFGLAYRSSE